MSVLYVHTTETQDLTPIIAKGAAMPLDTLPPGWEVWNEEAEGRVILAYHPDVFNGADFDAACLPTITVAPGGSPDQHPERRKRSERWHVALYLEPTVRARGRDASFETRSAAVEGALEVAERFSAGAVDYRGAYMDPREDYLDELDRLVGREG